MRRLHEDIMLKEKKKKKQSNLCVFDCFVCHRDECGKRGKSWKWGAGGRGVLGGGGSAKRSLQSLFRNLLCTFMGKCCWKFQQRGVIALVPYGFHFGWGSI